MLRINVLIAFINLLIFSACSRMDVSPVVWPVFTDKDTMEFRTNDISPLELAFLEAGLIDVHNLDSTIRVDLRYGTPDNFMGIDFYGGFNKCFLQPRVAEMLVKAQQEMKRIDSGLSLLVWDAARPLSVQKKMWELVVPPPGMSKGLFVSNPAHGSLHNYGCAVDVTIVNDAGMLLDMGTDLDHFGPEAYPVEEQRMLKVGKLSVQQVTNRRLLRSVMYAAGFWNIQTEWWHFNAMRREVARQQYRIIK